MNAIHHSSKGDSVMFRSSLIAVVALALFTFAQSAQAAIVAGGLIQDLDGDAGVTVSGTTVTDWANQGRRPTASR